MNKKTVRIGQAGITNHGETILTAIGAAESLELVSLFDVKSREVAAAAEKLKVRPAASYEDLVNDPAIDAVALVTPNQLHADEVEMAAKAGKHVFVEKPIAGTLGDARRVINAMKTARRTLMVGHNTRRRPVFRKAKQILKEQKLGRIVGVEMNLSRPAGLFPDLPPWKADPKTTPILPMTQLGIHFVDTVMYLFEAEIASVSCVASNVAMEGGALDASAALFQLSTGIPVTLSSYYVSPDVYYCQIYGTKGILRCSNAGIELDLLDNGALKRVTTEQFPSEGFASYIEEMDEFGQCILSGKPPETGGEEGLKSLAVIEGMTQSFRTQSVIVPANLLKD